MKALRVFLGIIAFFLTVALFAVILAGILRAGLSRAARKETIESALAGMDRSALLSELQSAADGIPEEYRRMFDSEELAAAASEALGSFAGDYVQYILRGEGEFELDREKLDGIFYGAVDEYARVNGITISAADMETITAEYENALAQLSENLPDIPENDLAAAVSGQEYDEDIRRAVKAVRFAASKKAAGIIALAAVLLCAMIALCRMSFWRWLLPAGIAALCAGSLFFFSGVAVKNFLLPALRSSAEQNPATPLIENFILSAQKAFGSAGLYVMLAGAAAIVLHIILSCALRRVPQE